MAIRYVPGSSGWDDNGVFGGHAQLRMKLESSYNAEANRSTLTVTMQCRAPNFGGRYYLLDNVLLRLNGGTFFSGGGSAMSSLNYYTDLQADDNWHDLCDGTSGETMHWTLSLDHDAQGRAEAELGVTVRLYRNESFYLTFYGLSGTAVFEETRHFTLTISAGEGCTVSVLRGDTALSSGAQLSWGDELHISFAAQSGYELVSHTVNGESFASGGVHTVSGDVSVAAEARHGSYPLSISAGQGCSVSVLRDGREISAGVSLHDGDRLQIIFTALPGYELVSHTVNGQSFMSGGLLLVSGPVTIAASARRVGQLRLDTGSAIVPCRVLLDTGSAIVPVRLFLDLGSCYTEV